LTFYGMVVLLNMVQSFSIMYDDAADPRGQSASSAPKHITSSIMLHGFALMLQMYTIAKSRDHSLFFLASCKRNPQSQGRPSQIARHHSAPVCSIQIGLHLGI